MAFIDASMFAASAPNICGILHNILVGSSYPALGAVIDARGLNSTNTSMACTASPWNGINSPPPSVILLPAGTIKTSASWILPSNTKLIGTAKGNGAIGTTNYGFETAIQASQSFSGAVVQFGNSNFCPSGCQGISVEQGAPRFAVFETWDGWTPTKKYFQNVALSTGFHRRVPRGTFGWLVGRNPFEASPPHKTEVVST